MSLIRSSFSRGDIVYVTMGRPMGRHNSKDIIPIQEVAAIWSSSNLIDPRDSSKCYWVKVGSTTMHVSVNDMKLLFTK